VMPGRYATKKQTLSKEFLHILQKTYGARRQDIPAKSRLFAQGEEATTIFYIEHGKVHLTVVSKQGRGGGDDWIDP